MSRGNSDLLANDGSDLFDVFGIVHAGGNLDSNRSEGIDQEGCIVHVENLSNHIIIKRTSRDVIDGQNGEWYGT